MSVVSHCVIGLITAYKWCEWGQQRVRCGGTEGALDVAVGVINEKYVGLDTVRVQQIPRDARLAAAPAAHARVPHAIATEHGPNQRPQVS